MSQEQQQPPPSPPLDSQPDPPPAPPLPFDPSRRCPDFPIYEPRALFCIISQYIYVCAVIGIIKRKALIKELAAVYHAECLAKCQELLELQKKWDEPFIDLKIPDDLRKEKIRPSKRVKKSR
ncbi:hypothetical protein Gorai_008392 [Gossypium raimondii]|uniref:Uncharacterized protein n=1 Tax=Gossypium raimondii TaxID=29730 RepID=A0A7J8QBJ8_GOSRA|nr:hypothetical protein [Gossypium raimondii]